MEKFWEDVLSHGVHVVYGDFNRRATPRPSSLESLAFSMFNHDLEFEREGNKPSWLQAGFPLSSVTTVQQFACWLWVATCYAVSVKVKQLREVLHKYKNGMETCILVSGVAQKVKAQLQRCTVSPLEQTASLRFGAYVDTSLLPSDYLLPSAF